MLTEMPINIYMMSPLDLNMFISDSKRLVWCPLNIHPLAINILSLIQFEIVALFLVALGFCLSAFILNQPHFLLLKSCPYHCR